MGEGFHEMDRGSLHPPSLLAHCNVFTSVPAVDLWVLLSDFN